MQEKRTVSVTVKMSPSDWVVLKKAAQVFWPGAILTNSSIILSLAKMGAKKGGPGG